MTFSGACRHRRATLADTLDAAKWLHATKSLSDQPVVRLLDRDARYKPGAVALKLKRCSR
jgi:hypothetical protein